MVTLAENGNRPILTARQGTNADLMAEVFRLYVPEGATVADVTYGKGVFWQQIDRSRYTVLATDLMGGVDFRSLPYAEASMDALVLDPPYMHGGQTVKHSINKCYRNDNDYHTSIIRLYAGGLLEAARVLKRNGIIIVKCQDEIESRKQHWSHAEILQMLDLFGFETVDLFVLMQNSVPAMRLPYQHTARKNHSYAIVARFIR